MWKYIETCVLPSFIVPLSTARCYSGFWLSDKALSTVPKGKEKIAKTILDHAATEGQQRGTRLVYNVFNLWLKASFSLSLCFPEPSYLFTLQNRDPLTRLNVKTVRDMTLLPWQRERDFILSYHRDHLQDFLRDCPFEFASGFQEKRGDTFFPNFFFYI